MVIKISFVFYLEKTYMSDNALEKISSVGKKKKISSGAVVGACDVKKKLVIIIIIIKGN